MANVIIKASGGTGLVNGSLNITWTVGKDGPKKVGKASYVVIAETATTSEESIKATTGIPQLTEERNGMWCNSVVADELGPCKHPDTQVDTRKWQLTIGWDSHADFSQNDDNPLLRPVVVSRTSETEIDRLIYDAVSGDPVVTTNLEPMDVKRPITIPTFTLTRYEAYPFSDATIRSLTNGVNNTAWRGNPIGTVWMTRVSTNEETIKNTRYEKVQYTVKIRINPDNPSQEDTWKAIEPHVGRYYKDPLGDITNTGRFGQISNELFRLKVSDGTLLDDTDPLEYKPWHRMRKITFPTGLE